VAIILISGFQVCCCLLCDLFIAAVYWNLWLLFF